MIELKPDNGWIAKDANGVQYPWYVSGVLEILDKMDLKGKRVFEYGVGNSTLWYRSRGSIVKGVDSNIEWATFASVDHRSEKDRYLSAIARHDPFDIVVIDGAYRDECLLNALGCLKKDGIIIIDNWEQPSVDHDPDAWTNTKYWLAFDSIKHTIYKQEGHPDWQTLIAYP